MILNVLRNGRSVIVREFQQKSISPLVQDALWTSALKGKPSAWHTLALFVSAPVLVYRGGRRDRGAGL